MKFEIREITSDDDVDWSAHWAVHNRVLGEMTGPATRYDVDPATRREADHRFPNPTLYLNAVAGTEVVGIGFARARTRAVPRVAWSHVYVAPEATGHGIGSTLVAQLEEFAREQDAVRIEAAVLHGEGQPTPSQRAETLVAGRGWRNFRNDVLRELALPATVEAPDAPGYQIQVLRSPDDHLEALALLKTRMGELIPNGDLGNAVHTWTPDDIATHYRRGDGELIWIGLATTSSGEPAGFVDMTNESAAATESARAQLHQGDTLVLPEHRGHSLGLALKAATLTRAQADAPWLRRQTTSNTDTNTWMIAINERLGYRVTGRVTNWYLPL